MINRYVCPIILQSTMSFRPNVSTQTPLCLYHVILGFGVLLPSDWRQWKQKIDIESDVEDLSSDFC